MRLCEICKSIPFGDLPPFPEDRYIITSSGKPHYQQVIPADLAYTIRDNADVEHKDEPPLGFRYHEDRGGLWQSAAGLCDLCRLVEGQARLVLADLDALDDSMRSRYPVPDFDLWVTARHKAGDGFWVLSRCRGAEHAERILVVIAAVGFCVDRDDPLSSMFVGRPVDEIPGETSFKLVRGWLSESVDAEKAERSDFRSVLPDRLVDVGDTASAASTVTVVKPEEAGGGLYTALSYLWDHTDGNQKHAAAQSSSDDKANAASGSPIDIASLPQTFQHAVVLTRKLGLRYLWIDVLCIPSLGPDSQGKVEGRDSESVDAVYKNAYVTIAATGASDSSEGLFLRRPKRTYVRIPLEGAGKVDSSGSPLPPGTILAFPLPLQAEVTGQHGELKSEPLSRSAWALRDRMLSRRIVHFSGDQIFFEGPGVNRGADGIVSEEGIRVPRLLALKPPKLHSSHPDTASGEKGQEQTLEAEKEAEKAVDKVSARNSFFPSQIQLWHDAVARFGPLLLSDPADKLLSVAGVAQAFRESQGIPDAHLDGGIDDYMAGIWSSHLVECLLWQPLRCSAIQWKDDESKRPPSWSWASVQGKAVGGIVSPWDATAALVDVRVEPVHPDRPFGRVNTGAWLKLRAPMLPLALCESKKGPTGNILLEIRGGGEGDGAASATYALFDTIDRSFEVSADQIRQKPLFALVLARTYLSVDDKSKGPDAAHGYQALIVTPAEDNDSDGGEKDGLMRRLGFMMLSGDSVRKAGVESGALLQTVKLL